jgi:hypothetical protein
MEKCGSEAKSNSWCCLALATRVVNGQLQLQVNVGPESEWNETFHYKGPLKIGERARFGAAIWRSRVRKVTGFSGVTAPSPPPAADPLDETFIDLDGPSAQIFRQVPHLH